MKRLNSLTSLQATKPWPLLTCVVAGSAAWAAEIELVYESKGKRVASRSAAIRALSLELKNRHRVVLAPALLMLVGGAILGLRRHRRKAGPWGRGDLPHGGLLDQWR